jgi:hypothetical protein
MKCRDFKRLVHEQLDAGAAGPLETFPALAEHAACCAACRAAMRRYDVLHQAIAAWTQRPVMPPADFAARFPANWAALDRAAVAPASRFRSQGLPALSSLAAAAVVLLLVEVGIRTGWPRRPAAPRGPANAAPATRPIDPEALAIALSEATSATWELARLTSGPAARVGLQVLDAPALASSPPPLAIPGDVKPGPASEVLQDVGQRVNDEVGPLSVTARHAFGFLIGESGG